MLINIYDSYELVGLARSRARKYETTTVSPKQAEVLVAEGWNVDRESAKSTRLKRDKLHSTYFEDRVWILLYRMGFGYMSAAGGAQLVLNAKEKDSPASQIDVAAIDDDLALAIECKSAVTPGKRNQFGQELGKHSLLRERFTAAVRHQFPHAHKRQTVLAFFLENALLSDNDKSRAKEANIAVFQERELDYYENLVSHIGPAAKYQFLADMLPGKSVPGLAIRVPAIKARMGKNTCYTFSISPEYLLKISYVSHRSKGKASDIDTYQRMLKKGRLNKIREYINDDGVFPTNIVVNLDKNRLVFERSSQEGTDQESGVAGWLDIRPAYKSAWVIDGQHRLFAYSGSDRAAKSRLAVLAFEGLAASEQARLFIDINAKQKSVKQSLLQELFAELHWDADDPQIRIQAIISKAVQALDADPLSPLHQRIQTADAAKDFKRCISLTSVYETIAKNKFHIKRVGKDGSVVLYGPLWAGGNEATLDRTVSVVGKWLDTIRSGAGDWWDRGSAPGGGLAMNEGVITCINLLKNVLSEFQDEKLIQLDIDELSELVRPYGVALLAILADCRKRSEKRFGRFVAYRGRRGGRGTVRRLFATLSQGLIQKAWIVSSKNKTPRQIFAANRSLIRSSCGSNVLF